MRAPAILALAWLGACASPAVPASPGDAGPRAVLADVGARSSSGRFDAGARPRPPPTTPPPARAPRGERALWALQARLAAARAPLRATPRLALGAPRAGVRRVAVRLQRAGPTWTARLMRCEPPADGDCGGGWEDGVCECAVLLLEAGRERRALVVSESAALGRVRLQALGRPDGGGGLWLAADLYDRVSPWPRVGLLVEGAPTPVLAWRGQLATCAFELRGDPEDERAPVLCPPAETRVGYGTAGELVVEDAAGRRVFVRAADGSLAAAPSR